MTKHGAKQRAETNVNKISVTERIGGLFKRHLATLARETEQKWYQALPAAVKLWNKTYISKLRLHPPDHYSARNFDELIAELYERQPVEEHALYPIGASFTERQLRSIFRFRPGDRVRVSMRTISKRMRAPVITHTIRLATNRRNRIVLRAVLQALLRVALQELGDGQDRGAQVRLLQGEERRDAGLRGSALARQTRQRGLRG